MPGRGIRRLLVVCPSFVTDCLETLEEISVAGRKTFLDSGGESFLQIPCLNDRQPYIEFLAGRARKWLGSGNHVGQETENARSASEVAA